VNAQRPRYTRIFLAAYLAVVALVCSFILFEVLDIDGSDFLPLTTAVDARLVESHHDDLKRAILMVAPALSARRLPGVAHLVVLSGAERSAARSAPRFIPSLATLALLPRATLGDGPAA